VDLPFRERLQTQNLAATGDLRAVGHPRTVQVLVALAAAHPDPHAITAAASTPMRLQLTASEALGSSYGGDSTSVDLARSPGTRRLDGPLQLAVPPPPPLHIQPRTRRMVPRAGPPEHGPAGAPGFEQPRATAP